MTTAQQLKTLFDIKAANYRTQPQHLEQLLNEEIEDAIKAGRRLAA